MGNEMGNSNSSELQEEENPSTQNQERSLQEATHANGAVGEKHIVPIAEHKDYHEKANGLASDITKADGDSTAVIVNQISEGREKEDTEVHHPAESPEVQVKSNEGGGETREIQPTSPSKDSKDHENPPDYVDIAHGNHIDPVAEGEDKFENEIDRLAPDVTEEAGDPHDLKQTSNEGELKSNNEEGGEIKQQETVHSPPESATVQVNSNNEERGETSEIKEQEETEVHSPPESATVQVNSNNEERGETSEIKEQEETEVYFPLESSTVQVKSDNEAGGETREIEEKEETEVRSAPEYSTVRVKSNNEGGGETSEIKEQKETEVHSSSESSTVEVKSTNEAGGEMNEIQATFPWRDLRDHEKPVDLTYVTGGNDIVPVAEDEDDLEVQVDGLASVVPDGAGNSPIVNQISDERERKETEVNTPAESLNVEEKSNNGEGCKPSDIQPTSPSKASKDHEMSPGSNLVENLSRISNHQLEKQASVRRVVTEEEEEENSTFNARSSSNDPEPQEIVDSEVDQPELATIRADPLVQDGNRSPEKIEDILGSNLTYTSEENGQPIGTNKPDIGESVVSVDMNPEKKITVELIVNELASKEVSCEEILEIKGDEVGNGLGKRTMITSEFTSSVGIKCNGELPIEVNPIASDSPKAESKHISMDESLNTLLKVSEATEDCMVLAAETILIGEESERGENKADQDPTQSCGRGESVEVIKIDKASVSASELVMIESEPQNSERRTSDHTSCDSGSNEDGIEEAKVAEDRQPFGMHIDQNEAPVETGKDSQKEAVMLLESGTYTTDLLLTGCKRIDESEENKVIDEIEGILKASFGIENDKEGRESLKQCISPLPLEQHGEFPQKAPLPLVHPQDTKQYHEKDFKKKQSTNESISELKQGSFGDYFVAPQASTYDAKNLTAAPLVLVAELATKQDLSQCNMESLVMVGESDTPANHFVGQCPKVETPAVASDKYESLERLSTESNPNSSSIPGKMQKSPSFGLDLRIKARTEESDRTPLLFQDKTAIDDLPCQADISLGNPIAHTQHGQNTLLYQATAVEEKVVPMERSDSDKLKTPFLGFLKEEEEAQIIVTPQKHDKNAAAKKANAKEVTSASPKSKEKRKPRSSLFTNCMCCTTAIN